MNLISYTFPQQKTTIFAVKGGDFMDEKHDKFLTVSVDLVRKAVASIEKVGKISNKKQYEYSQEEVEKMFSVLEKSLEETKALFDEKKEFSWD